MKLATNIAKREIARNKSRLFIACLISLLLFLSAFILLNMSYALPKNFYTYYENYYGKDMVLEVKDANRQLLIDNSKYFENYKIYYENINSKFTLTSTSGDKEFNYLAQIGENDGITHVYKSAFTGSISAKKFAERYGNDVWEGGSTPWSKESAKGDLWISDIVAERLGVRIGERIKINFELENSETDLNTYNIQGIFSNEICSRRDANPPVFYLNDADAIDIVLNNFDTFTLSGKVKSVDVLYDVYNKLSKKYTVNQTVQVDMLFAVKNAEAISAIIGSCMLAGGLCVIMNFITMFISTNRKNIGLMRALGAKSSSIAIGYGMVYEILLIVITLISLAVTPTVNMLLSKFIKYVGYAFAIETNFWLLLSLYGISNIGMVLIMLVENLRIKRLSPKNVLKEED